MGDAEHDAARVTPQPGARPELLLAHVGQEPEHLAPDLGVDLEQLEEDVDSVVDGVVKDGVSPALLDLRDLSGAANIADNNNNNNYNNNNNNNHNNNNNNNNQ